MNHPKKPPMHLSIPENTYQTINKEFRMLVTFNLIGFVVLIPQPINKYLIILNVHPGSKIAPKSHSELRHTFGGYVVTARRWRSVIRGGDMV